MSFEMMIVLYITVHVRLQIIRISRDTLGTCGHDDRCHGGRYNDDDGHRRGNANDRSGHHDRHDNRRHELYSRDDPPLHRYYHHHRRRHHSCCCHRVVGTGRTHHASPTSSAHSILPSGLGCDVLVVRVVAKDDRDNCQSHHGINAFMIEGEGGNGITRRQKVGGGVYFCTQ